MSIIMVKSGSMHPDNAMFLLWCKHILFLSQYVTRCLGLRDEGQTKVSICRTRI